MASPKITIHRYEHPKQVGWSGYVEPEDRTWIVFFGDGHAQFYGRRDPETGAVAEQPGTMASTT